MADSHSSYSSRSMGPTFQPRFMQGRCTACVTAATNVAIAAATVDDCLPSNYKISKPKDCICFLGDRRLDKEFASDDNSSADCNDGSANDDDLDWLEGDVAVAQCAAFERICSQRDPRELEDAYPTALSAQNKGKNRYNGVYPEEEHRVPIGPDGIGYINANFVWGLSKKERCYVSTQAPLPSTIVDFWLMCYEQRPPVIIMLTRMVENSRQKANLYWPVEVNRPRTWGSIRVTVLACYEEKNTLQVRKIRLEVVDDPSAPVREVYQVQCMVWPDYGVPASTGGIRRIMTLMQRLRRNAVAVAGGDKEAVGPPVVHCSAGIGRSGTFIAAALLDEELAGGASLRELKVPETVAAMRTQRAGCVQTPDQFSFLRRLLCDRARYWKRVRTMGDVDVDLGLERSDASEYDSFPEDTDDFSGAFPRNDLRMRLSMSQLLHNTP